MTEPSGETDKLAKLAAEGRLLRHCVRGVQFFADPLNDAVQGVGAHLWFAARALIDFVAPDGQGAVSPGARVCELGAGCGAVGLTLHALSNCTVTLTDQPHVLPLLRFNAAHVACAHPTREPAHVSPLRWGDAHDVATQSIERFDVLLGADITYEPSQHLPLLTTMEALCDGKRTRVLLAFAHRGDGTLNRFLKLVATQGWDFHPVLIAQNGDEGCEGANPVVVLEGRAPSRSKTEGTPALCRAWPALMPSEC